MIIFLYAAITFHTTHTVLRISSLTEVKVIPNSHFQAQEATKAIKYREMISGTPNVIVCV